MPDDEDVDPASVAALLDAMDDAYERAMEGLRQAGAGDTVSLDAL